MSSLDKVSFALIFFKKHRKSLGHRKNLEHSQIQKKTKAKMTKFQLFSKCQVFTWTGLIFTVLTHVHHSRLNFPGKHLKVHILKKLMQLYILLSFHLFPHSKKQSDTAWPKQQTQIKIRCIIFGSTISIFQRKFGFMIRNFEGI